MTKRRVDEWEHVRYIGQGVPRAVPRGRILVHNHVRPVGMTPGTRAGDHGFRAWTMKPHASVELCTCGWAPLVRQHYRVRRAV